MLSGKYTLPDILERRSKKGARWFMIIAILGIINSAIVNYTDSYINLFAGLGFMQIADGLAQKYRYYYEGAFFFSAAFNIMFALLFVFIGIRSKAYSFGWFLTGLIIYFIDSLIFLAYLEGKSFMFHMLIMFFLIAGFISVKQINRRRIKENTP